jgi:sulfotransferase
MNSFEWLFLQNPFNISTMYGPVISEKENKQLFFSENAKMRFMHLLGIVIPPLESMKEMYFGPFKSKLLLIEYKDLCHYPQETMQRVYQFLEEDLFDHNFDNIQSDYSKFDNFINTPGMHEVKRQIKSEGREMILAPELIEKCNGLEFWRDFYFTKS